MKLKKGIFLSVLLIILILFTVSAASAAPWDDISDNSVIYLGNQTYEITSQITIDKENVTIYGGFQPTFGDGWDGNTSTLDGFGHLIMNITGNNAKLVGINFINGSGSDGGALYVKGNIAIENCEFINNTATSKGGAIFAANLVASQSDVNPDTYDNPVTYSISLKNCLFENNTALQGGAVYTFIMKTDILNCTFIGNNATQEMGTGGTRFTGAGGALYIDSNDKNSTLTVYKDDGYVNWGDKLTLTNSKFVDNYAPKAVGGAIHLFRPKEGCIDNNTFENNTAYRVGAVNIEGSQWFKVSTDILNSKFNYNKATYIIGAVYYLDSGNSIVKNCEFNNNNGSLQCGALQGYDVVNLTINNCTFNNNTCENDGGAIYLWRAAELNIFNSKFNDNKAIYGGSIFIYEDSGIPKKYEDGIDTYCNISNTIFTNNKAVNGTLYFYYKPSTKTTLTVTIKNSAFINNTATDTAGAIYDDNLKQLNVENSIFDNNTGDGTIYLTNDNYTLDKNFFATNNSITSDEFKADKIISKNGDCIAPDEIIVLNITSSDNKYKLVFISNKTKSQVIMPYYEANVAINGGSPTVVPVNKDQSFSASGKTNIKATSIYSKTLLANLTTEITPPPKTDVDINVQAQDILLGENATVTVTITPKYATGIVSIDIDGISYEGALKDGKYSATFKDLNLGKHNINVFYFGDSKYNGAYKKATITVKNDTEMTVEYTPEVIYEGDKVTVTVKLPSNATGQVTFQIEGLTGWSTENITKGIAKHTFTNLKEGNVTIRVLYKGDDVYIYKSEDISFEVKTKYVIFETYDLTKYFKGEDRFTAVITEKGIGIANETVTFIINGIVYTKTTDKNGVASIAINLNPGTYKVNTVYKNTTRENTVIVKSTMSGNDIVKYYRNGTQYSSYATDSKGNPLVNKTVTYNINGVFYYRTTDDKGIATLNINLNPGEYTITAYNSVTGEATSNTVKVLPILEGKDLNMSYKDGSKYECKLVDGQGKAVKGAEVVLNINGVFYHKITDDNGIARLNINLNPGEYIITAIYNTTMTSNIIKIRD